MRELDDLLEKLDTLYFPLDEVNITVRKKKLCRKMINGKGIQPR